MKKYLFFVLIAISTTISAQTWQVLNSGVPATLKVSALCFTGDSQFDIGYAVGGQYYQTGFVIKTTDGGDTWSAQTVLTNDYATGVSFPTSQVGFVCAQNGKIFKTTDGGTSWTRAPGLLPVAVDDIRIQMPTGDVVLGTYGRGIVVGEGSDE